MTRTLERSSTPEQNRARYTVELPAPAPLGPAIGSPLAFLPHRRGLVYAAGGSLFVREHGDLRPRSLSAREPYAPTPSPDGARIAYGTSGAIAELTLDTGTIRTLAVAPAARGVAYVSPEELVFAPDYNSPLWRVTTNGGSAQPWTTLDPLRGEVTHRWPEALPNGKGVLFTVRTRDALTFDDAEIACADLARGTHRILLRRGTNPRFLPPRTLLFQRADTLFRADFDVERLALNGSPVPWMTGVGANPTTGAGMFAVSGDGELAWAPHTWDASGYGLQEIDRSGRVTRLGQGWRSIVEQLRVSPDGRFVAFTLVEAQNDIGVFDRASGQITRLTATPWDETSPIWLPDGSGIAYAATHGEVTRVQIASRDGDRVETLFEQPFAVSPCDFDPTGRTLLCTEIHPQTGVDLWAFDRVTGKRTPVVRTPHNEIAGRFSPDGRWIAFDSDAAGEREIRVVPSPSAGARGLVPGTRVSAGPGVLPVWSASGREIFFSRGTERLVVAFDPILGRALGHPNLMFDLPGNVHFESTPDGTFVMMGIADLLLFPRIHVQMESVAKDRSDRIHFAIDLSSGEAPRSSAVPMLAIAPAGDAVAYRAQDGRLLLRPIADARTRSFGRVTEGAPVFAPDGRRLAFAHEGWIAAVRSDGGPADTLAEATTLRGMSWSEAGLVFAPVADGGLWLADPSRGSARPLTRLDATRGEISHRWPHVLPAERGVLFTVRNEAGASFDDAEIALADVRSGEHRILWRGGTMPRFVPPNRLVYCRAETLFVLAFDPLSGRITGPPIPCHAGVAMDPTTGAAHYDISRDGTLVFAEVFRPARADSLVWVDRKGLGRETADVPASVPGPSIGTGRRRVPRGDWIAAEEEVSGALHVVLRHRSQHMMPIRVSRDGGYWPVWSRSGREIFFRSGDAMMTAVVDLEARPPVVLEPRTLFEGSFSGAFTVSADERSFLVRPSLDQPLARRLHVITGWVEALASPR